MFLTHALAQGIMSEIYSSNRVYLCIRVFIDNKVVEGSGSKGAPKYVGEGVTYRVFLGTIVVFFHMNVRADVPRQLVHTDAYTVAMKCRGMMSQRILMTSSLDMFMTS